MIDWEKILNIDTEVEALNSIEEFLNIQFPLFTRQIKWNEFGVYVQNKTIHGIGFYSQKIRTIPADLWELKFLEVLNLVNTGLVEIPEEIGSISSLQELYIGGNKIQSCPQSIERLKNLIYFYLLEDNLLTVPEEIGHLVTLKELSISSQKIDMIPKSIIQLKNKGCRIYFNQKEI